MCPSYNTRCMAKMAAHLVDHGFLQVAMHQWVLSSSMQLRRFLHRDRGVHASAAVNVTYRTERSAVDRLSLGAGPAPATPR